jgi:hypothetical protein
MVTLLYQTVPVHASDLRFVLILSCRLRLGLIDKGMYIQIWKRNETQLAIA